MNLQMILDLVAERQAAAQHNADRFREQITTLTAELAHIDNELADLASTRSTLRTLAAAEFTADEPTVISSAYQQVLTVLSSTATGMRAKDICLALGVEPLPKHVEGARAKLKRMVTRKILTENEPGIFTLAEKQTQSPEPPSRSASRRPRSGLPAGRSADSPRYTPFGG